MQHMDALIKGFPRSKLFFSRSPLPALYVFSLPERTHQCLGDRGWGLLSLGSVDTRRVEKRGKGGGGYQGGMQV